MGAAIVVATNRYLTAAEASAELGVSRPTLYSYVSRGLIRSEASPAGKARRYRVEDVARLKERQAQRRDPKRAAAQALHWGVPVLDSAISLIRDGRLYYRGQNALELATRQPVEAVAGLIWTGELAGRWPAGPALRLPPALKAAAAALPLYEQLQALLPAAAAQDLAAYDLRPAAVAQTGGRILRLMTAIIAGRPAGEDGIARTLQAAWRPAEPAAAALLNASLILCADHELNVSSFTARCVASAGASPYAVVAAGLAALQGVRHGGHTARVEALLREAGAAGEARPALAGRLRRGEAIPGFKHVLYPDGDPRAWLLLRLVNDGWGGTPGVRLLNSLVTEAQGLIGDHPALDFGLAAVATALELPPGSALILFALGRTIGWIGQAIEQYELERMIRPRARYVGPQPAGDK